MTRLETGDITVEDGPDVALDITIRGGDERSAEYVHTHAVDAAVRAMQAIANDTHPDECEGTNIGVDWDRALEILREEGER